MTEGIEVRLEQLPNDGLSIWVHQEGRYYQEHGDWSAGVWFCVWSSDGGNPGKHRQYNDKVFLAGTTLTDPIPVPHQDVKASS